VDSNKSKCWAIKGSKPIIFTNGSKAKINIGGFFTENGDFYWYDLEPIRKVVTCCNFYNTQYAKPE